MIDSLLDVLERATVLSGPLAWLVIATFLLGVVLEWAGERERARLAAVTGWGLFGVFWFSLIYHFAIVQKSFVEGIGSVVAVPLAFYVGYLLWQGRDSLFMLSRAIPIMGLVFFPVESIPFVRQFLVETVTSQTEFLMGLTGHHPEAVSGSQAVIDADPYRSTFVFYTDVPYIENGEDHRITYTILTACTGIGSISIFAGLIAATDAPMRRKVRALAVSVPVIYALNLVRNVFIGITFGKQYLHVFPDTVLMLFGSENVPKVSYYVADRILAQSLSVVALVGITYLVVRELPEILDIVEDLLFVVTGSEYDLRSAMDPPAVRADGGD